MLNRVVRQLKPQNLQNNSFHFDHFILIFAINPFSKVRGVDLLILHSDEETGLSGMNCLVLVLKLEVFWEEEVQVEDGKVQGCFEEVELVVYFEDVPD